MSDAPHKPTAPVVVNTTRRDAFIAIIAGLLVLAFVVYAVVYLSGRMTSHSLRGVITDKHFRADPQTQITIGQRGLSKKKVEGEYTLEVHVDSTGRTTLVSVDLKIYKAKKIGDAFEFPRPPHSVANQGAE